MPLTSKQRAKLKSYATKLNTILQIGKGGIVDTLVRQTDDALTAREMIKLRVLESAPLPASDAAAALAEATGSEVVQVIGSRLILYRRHKKEPKFLID